MANDPSMPPSEQSPSVPTDNSPEMSQSPSAEAPATTPDAGNVMISMPKAAFDAMHSLVTQLAMGLEELKKSVDAGATGPAPMAPEAYAPAEAATPEGQSDEEFLKGLAEEGNKR